MPIRGTAQPRRAPDAGRAFGASVGARPTVARPARVTPSVVWPMPRGSGVSRLTLVRRLIFAAGAVVALAMTPLATVVAKDEVDLAAYRWAPVWTGIPLLFI